MRNLANGFVSPVFKCLGKDADSNQNERLTVLENHRNLNKLGDLFDVFAEGVIDNLMPLLEREAEVLMEQ
jgi:hypothetical protein